MAFFPTDIPTPVEVCEDPRPTYYAEYGKCSPIFSLPDILEEIKAAQRYAGALIPGAADIAGKAEGGVFQPFYDSTYPEPPSGGDGCDDDDEDDDEDEEETSNCNSKTRKYIIYEDEWYLVQDLRFGLEVDKESLPNQISNSIKVLAFLNGEDDLPKEAEKTRKEIEEAIPVLQILTQDRWERYWT